MCRLTVRNISQTDYPMPHGFDPIPVGGEVELYALMLDKAEAEQVAFDGVFIKGVLQLVEDGFNTFNGATCLVDIPKPALLDAAWQGNVSFSGQRCFSTNDPDTTYFEKKTGKCGNSMSWFALQEIGPAKVTYSAEGAGNIRVYLQDKNGVIVSPYTIKDGVGKAEKTVIMELLKGQELIVTAQPMSGTITLTDVKLTVQEN